MDFEIGDEVGLCNGYIGGLILEIINKISDRKYLCKVTFAENDCRKLIDTEHQFYESELVQISDKNKYILKGK